MAEEYYSLPENPVYNAGEIRKIQDSDPVKASTIVNPLISRLIENTHAVKLQADEKQDKLTGTAGQIVGFNAAGEMNALTLQAGDGLSLTQSGSTVTISLNSEAKTAVETLKKLLGGVLPSPTLANNTPDIIQKVAAAGFGANFWGVGDKIGIAVNGTFGGLSYNSTVYAFILGFNHNSAVEGNNSIHFQFGKTNTGTDIAFVNSYNNAGIGFCMNTTNTNSGGWNNSYMRETICPAFLSALPTAWQNVIVACTKYSDNTGGGSDTASYVTSTLDKIWLLNEIEVYGICKYSNSAETNYTKQYDYYKNGNSKVKYRHTGTSYACFCWLRSVVVGFPCFFCYVDTGGGSEGMDAFYSYGFAPGFKVA